MKTCGAAGPSSTPQQANAFLRAVAADTLQNLGYEALQTPNPATPVVADAFATVLAYHQRCFREAGRPADEQSVRDTLARGEFAYGQRAGVNLWEDVALATMIAGRDDHAAEVFRGRFRDRVAGWQQRYSRGELYSAEDFLADLLVPRERAGPRIESYRGHGPFDGWLKQVYMSLCHKRRDRQRSAPAPTGILQQRTNSDGDPLDRLPSNEDAPDERYARYECAEKLAPLIAECMDVLDDDHRQVLLMSVVDGVQQKKIAQLYGVPEYKITRMKQAAIKRVADSFLKIARRSAQMAAESVRECIDLLLEKFPATWP